MNAFPFILHLKHGQTPLMRAAENGHLDTVKTFIDVGANLEISDRVCYSCS